MTKIRISFYSLRVATSKNPAVETDSGAVHPQFYKSGVQWRVLLPHGDLTVVADAFPLSEERIKLEEVENVSC